MVQPSPTPGLFAALLQRCDVSHHRENLLRRLLLPDWLTTLDVYPRCEVLRMRSTLSTWDPERHRARNHDRDPLVVFTFELITTPVQLFQTTERKRLEFLLRQSEVLLADRPEPPPRDALELWAFGGRALSSFGAWLVARMASFSFSRICSMSRGMSIRATSSTVSISGWNSRNPAQRSRMQRSVSARSASRRTSPRMENPDTRWNSIHAHMPKCRVNFCPRTSISTSSSGGMVYITARPS